LELYAHTARALKSGEARGLRVGGPATAAAALGDDFLKYAAANQVPVDFVSSHGYADDTVQNLFATTKNPDGRPGLPSHRDGAWADQGLVHAGAAAVLDGVECAGA
jgi:hypothetical protein